MVVSVWEGEGEGLKGKDFTVGCCGFSSRVDCVCTYDVYMCVQACVLCMFVCFLHACVITIPM